MTCKCYFQLNGHVAIYTKCFHLLDNINDVALHWCVGVGGGPIFSILSVWSLTHCHSWSSLPCSHQQTFSIATFYRPPATTISFNSTSSSPEKENSSSNRLGPPPPPPPSWGVEKPQGPSALQPLQRISSSLSFSE